ncbi:uncharacterized protein LOC141949128 [Strix uralensis]|uniref:uncharacterized protein LOC141949128 n=1 Tax=Strix uralensis TaxID=36305 RepID=UPI003DA2E5DC
MAGHLGTGDGTPPPTGIPPTRGVLGDRTPRGPQVMVEEAEPSAPVPGCPPIAERSEGARPDPGGVPPNPGGQRGAPPPNLGALRAALEVALTQDPGEAMLAELSPILGVPRPPRDKCQHLDGAQLLCDSLCLVCRGAATGFGGAADGAQHPGEVRLEPAAARPPRHCHTVHFGNPVCCGTVNAVQVPQNPQDPKTSRTPILPYHPNIYPTEPQFPSLASQYFAN